MRIPYTENMPKVKIRVRGLGGEREYDAYLDTGAGRTLIPERDAIRLGFPRAGYMQIITGSGKDSIRLYRAMVTFLNKDYSTLILGRDLPEQALIKAVVGRDILDHYNVCFDGVANEMVIK